MRHATCALLVASLAVGCGSSEDASSPGTGGSGGSGATAGGGSGGSATGGSGGQSGGASGSAGSASGGSAGQAAETKVGLSGDRFTVNGKPTFLLGASYFDGKNWHASDLDALAAKQFNLIRIWLDWATTGFFDAGGSLSAKTTLLDLVRAASQRGIVVDVTILDTDLSLSSPETAVTETVTALANEPNVFFDLVNEHDHSGDTFSHAEVAQLAQAARSANPSAILTVSSQGGHIVNDLTLVPSNVDAEIVDAKLDLLTPHLTRTADFFDKTDQRVTTIKTYLSSIGKSVPVYLQEEARRGHSGLDPSQAEFVQAATEARDAGAAGWVFHTDAGFDLATATFFDSLDDVEKATVDALGPAVLGP
jgi:hypothetical protein